MAMFLHTACLAWCYLTIQPTTAIAAVTMIATAATLGELTPSRPGGTALAPTSGDRRPSYGHHMDHLWAANQLRVFVTKIDHLIGLLSCDVVERTQASSLNATPERVADERILLEPVMQYLMNAARPGYGDYREEKNPTLKTQYEAPYWELGAKPWALRAIGIHELGAEARERMQPDSPISSPISSTHGSGKAAGPL
jgi:hypothetical protein